MADRDGNRRQDEDDRERPNAPSGTDPVAITTTDPVVTESQASWRRQPAETLVVDASEEVPAYAVAPSWGEPVRVERRPKRRPDDERRNRREPPRRRRGEHEEEDDDSDREESSSWSSHGGMILGLVLGLVLGLGGAWAYMHFYGSKSEDSQDGKNSQNQSASSGDSGQSSQSSQSQGQSRQSDQAAATPGFGAADDLQSVQKQLATLNERIDRLRQRLDRMKTPENAPPPGLQTLQIKVGELSREVDDVSYLPERVRRLENQLSDVAEKVRQASDQGGSGLTGPDPASETVSARPLMPTPSPTTR